MRGQRRARARVRHVAQLDAGRVRQQLHRHVQRAVDARGASTRSGPGRFFASSMKSFAVFHGLVGAHDEDRRVGGDQRDRRELVHGEGRRAAEDLVGLGDDRDRRERQQQRVAVGLARRHELHARRRRRRRSCSPRATGFLSTFSIAAATGRAVRSATPPGGNGATRVIGREGYGSWATAASARARSAARADGEEHGERVIRSLLPFRPGRAGRASPDPGGRTSTRFSSTSVSADRRAARRRSAACTKMRVVAVRHRQRLAQAQLDHRRQHDAEHDRRRLEVELAQQRSRARP